MNCWSAPLGGGKATLNTGAAVKAQVEEEDEEEGRRAF